jgi:hypothetical protein
VKVARQTHQEIKDGETFKVKMFKNIRDKFLLPNIAYLKEIGRLPEEFDGIDFEQELAIE